MGALCTRRPSFRCGKLKKIYWSMLLTCHYFYGRKRALHNSLNTFSNLLKSSTKKTKQ